MLQKRLSRLSINTSKRSSRRLTFVLRSTKPFLKLIPLLLVSFFAIILFLKALTIHKISCNTNGSICSKEIESMLNHFNNKSYFKIKRNELEWMIKQIFPLESLAYNFSYPNTLQVNITGVQDAFSIRSHQVLTLPALSIDIFAQSTESAEWSRPIPEIEKFSHSLEGQEQKIWEDGSLTTTSGASESGNIRLIYSSIPSKFQLSNIYKIISLAYRYLIDPKIFILNDRCFLSSPGLPDIIIYADANIKNVESSLQSLDYLVTIKEDARVFNLSFKHPIIK